MYSSYTEPSGEQNLSPTNPSAEELETVAALRVALRRFQAAADDVTAAHGLTPRQYDLLALLHVGQAPLLSSAEIAERLCLSRSAMTELLTRAAAAGLVVRVGDSADARVKRLSPTEEGTRRFFAAVADLRTERNRLLDMLHVAAGLAAALAIV
jgi:DNA-binding MarR family transcriptional regulator